MPRTRPSVAQASPATAAPRGCSNFKLRQATRLVSRHYDHFVADAGLKTSQYSLLSHLYTLGSLRPADLAAHMGLEPSTLTRNLQPLVAQGWVAVGPGADARSRLVTLTDAGRAKRTEGQRAWKKAQLAFNDKLGEARVVALHALLDECLQLMADDGTTGDGDE
jgi:DNA-binding MarR family transcriptional regulator